MGPCSGGDGQRLYWGALLKKTVAGPVEAPQKVGKSRPSSFVPPTRFLPTPRLE